MQRSRNPQLFWTCSSFRAISQTGPSISKRHYFLQLYCNHSNPVSCVLHCTMPWRLSCISTLLPLRVSPGGKKPNKTKQKQNKTKTHTHKWRGSHPTIAGNQDRRPTTAIRDGTEPFHFYSLQLYWLSLITSLEIKGQKYDLIINS